MLESIALMMGHPPAFALLLSDYTYSGITYTQSGNLTDFNSSGDLFTLSVNTLGLGYNPSTLALRGYPFWSAKTNSLRNNTMVGAVVGTPGTLPTNWVNTSAAGMTTNVIAIGTEGGVDYVDLQLTGSPSGTQYVLIFDSTTQIVAAQNDTWSAQLFIRRSAGTTTNIASFASRVRYGTAAGPLVELYDTVITPGSTSTTLPSQRMGGASTAVGATVARVVSGLVVNFTSTGVATDITLRVGLPSCSLSTFASPVIKTSTVAVTRAAPSPIISGSGFTAFWSSLANSIKVTFTPSTVVSGTYPIISFDDNTTNQQILLYISTTSLKLDVIDGGVTQASLTLGTVAANTEYSVAFRVQASNFAAIMTGGTIQTAGSGTLPVVDRCRLGTDKTGNYENGWLKTALQFSSGLSNASLASLAAS